MRSAVIVVLVLLATAGGCHKKSANKSYNPLTVEEAPPFEPQVANRLVDPAQPSGTSGVPATR